MIKIYTSAPYIFSVLLFIFFFSFFQHSCRKNTSYSDNPDVSSNTLDSNFFLYSENALILNSKKIYTYRFNSIYNKKSDSFWTFGLDDQPFSHSSKSLILNFKYGIPKPGIYSILSDIRKINSDQVYLEMLKYVWLYNRPGGSSGSYYPLSEFKAIEGQVKVDTWNNKIRFELINVVTNLKDSSGYLKASGYFVFDL